MEQAGLPHPILFKQKYRVRSARKKGWDYTNDGFYFVTICTKGRVPWFGEIIEGEMQLSEIGGIVEQCWKDIPKHYNSIVDIDAHQTMPEHFHGIIVIETPITTAPHQTNKTVQTPLSPPFTTSRSDQKYVCNQGGASPQHTKYHRTEWKPQSLGSIINQFKGACTRKIHKAGCTDFAWQPRFYDRIICSERGLQRVQRYIVNNPWKEACKKGA